MLALAAVLTPGFFSVVGLYALLTSMSLIGCVAVGMSFITLSGNIMSFSLGATLSATTIVFVSLLPVGLAGAALGAALFSAVVTGAQGWVVGFFRANPIIVSMAALALIVGVVTWLTGGRGVYPTGDEADVLQGRIGPVPMPVAACLASAVLGQAVLSWTAFGRNVVMVGSNMRAAHVAGVQTWRTVTGAYVAAGLFTAVAAILIASRYSSGDMGLGAGYDYEAISAVLVGGIAISGGEGSVWQALLGALVIAVCNALLLLNGLNTQWQYLAIGAIVLGVIMLQAGSAPD